MARSPNYPLMDLKEALSAIRPAFKAENRNVMSRAVLAGHMGYKGLSGRALGKLGAIRAYGLISGSGDELRISDDAINALNAPDGSSEKNEALARCALHPPLFKELNGSFSDGNVSLENLKFRLVQKHFTEEAAKKAAENYLATMKLVSGIDSGYSSSNSGASKFDEEKERGTGSDHDPERQRKKVKPGMNEDTFAMKEGTVVLQWPDRLSAESYEDFEAWAQLVLRKVKRHVANDEPDDLP